MVYTPTWRAYFAWCGACNLYPRVYFVLSPVWCAVVAVLGHHKGMALAVLFRDLFCSFVKVFVQVVTQMSPGFPKCLAASPPAFYFTPGGVQPTAQHTIVKLVFL